MTGTPYAYAGNDPLNTVDPSGLIGFSIGPVKVGDGCPLGKNPNGSCRGSGAVEAVGDVARSAPAQAIKSVSNTVSGVAGGVAAVSVVGAAAFPVAVPILVPVATGAEFVSAGTGAVATVIECLDGGSAFDCAAGIAGTAIPFVSFPVLKQFERMYGPELDRLGNAVLGSLGLAGVGASVARDRADGC